MMELNLHPMVTCTQSTSLERGQGPPLPHGWAHISLEVWFTAYVLRVGWRATWAASSLFHAVPQVWVTAHIFT